MRRRGIREELTAGKGKPGGGARKRADASIRLGLWNCKALGVSRYHDCDRSVLRGEKSSFCHNTKHCVAAGHCHAHSRAPGSVPSNDLVVSAHLGCGSTVGPLGALWA